MVRHGKTTCVITFCVIFNVNSQISGGPCQPMTYVVWAFLRDIIMLICD
jgi:hypothetical protein